MAKLAITNRHKRLAVLLVAAAWISADALRLSADWSASIMRLKGFPPPFFALFAQSLPAILFAGIMFWWYSER